MTKGPRNLATLAALLVLAIIGAGPAAASHSWNGYHWSRPSNPFTVTFGNNLSSNWSSYLTTACADWSLTSGACNNPANPIRCSIVAGSSNRNCRATLGRVEVCNGGPLARFTD